MCYWMMEKRFGATKESTEGKMRVPGTTEKAMPAEGPVIASRKPEEKMPAGFEWNFQGSAIKEEEEESVS